MSQESRDRLLAKVQKLLAKAESSPFSAEAQTFREKADELMTIHAIESFELDAASGVNKRTRVIRRDNVEVAGSNSTIRNSQLDLFNAVTFHCRVKPVYHGLTRAKSYPLYATLIGYEEDVEYAIMLYTSLRMSLASDISPKFDPSKTLGENVKRMKEAGMKWDRIASLCDPTWDGVMTSKWVNLYRKQCKLDGSAPIKAQPANYVKNFAAGFVTEVSSRLQDMRRASEAAVDSSQALVVFKTKADEISERTLEEFPSLRNILVRDNSKFNGTARMRGKESGSRADLSGGRHQTGTAQRGKALGR